MTVFIEVSEKAGYSVEAAHIDNELMGGPWFYEEFQKPWIAAYRLERQNGRLAIAELHIFAGGTKGDLDDRIATRQPSSPDGGITKRLLFKVSTESHLKNMSERFLRIFGRPVFGKILEPTEIRRLVKQATKVAPTAGRRGSSDLFYAGLAEAYVATLTGGRRKPIKELARTMNAPESKVRDYIREARNRELLTSTMRGRPGGALTDKAKKLLAARPASSGKGKK